MKIQIDQSGKVENTNKLTIVAYANGKTKILKINAREKRKLIMAMREIDNPKQIFIYKIFAGLVFLLIKSNKSTSFTIDKEYPGHEPFIKEVILQLFKRNGILAPRLDFALIGKNSEAHRVAIEAYRGQRKADIIVKAQEVFRLFYQITPQKKVGVPTRSGINLGSDRQLRTMVTKASNRKKYKSKK